MKLDIQPTSGNKKRLLVGLSWDALPGSSPSKGLLGTIIHTFKFGREWSKSEKKADAPGRDISFTGRDLDLLCFIFDENKRYIREINPSPDNLIDEAASVYHSGEEYTGEGVYDDETVTIDINKLPAEFKHFVFVVVSDSKLSLAECGTFKLRIADSSKDMNFILEDVTAPPGDTSAYVFTKISRDGDTWNAERLGHFGEFETDWQNELPKYL